MVYKSFMLWAEQVLLFDWPASQGAAYRETPTECQSPVLSIVPAWDSWAGEPREGRTPGERERERQTDRQGEQWSYSYYIHPISSSLLKVSWVCICFLEVSENGVWHVLRRLHQTWVCCVCRIFWLLIFSYWFDYSWARNTRSGSQMLLFFTLSHRAPIYWFSDNYL